MRKQFVHTVSKLMEEHQNVVLLLGDIGVFGFRDVIKKFPTRAFNIGILEQATVSVAAGWALRGYYPIIHTIAPFLAERAFEQIKIDLGYQKLSAMIATIGASYDYAALGCTHHCPADIALMSNVPGMKVVVPGNQEDLDFTITSSHEHKDLVYIRMSEMSNVAPVAPTLEYDKMFSVPNFNKGPVIVAVGPVMDIVNVAVQGLKASVVHVAQVEPLAAIDRILSLQNPKRQFIVVEPYYNSRIGDHIAEKEFPGSAAVSHFSVPIEFIERYGSKMEVDYLIGFTASKLRERIKQCETEG